MAPDPAVAAPLVRVHRRPREARPVHELIQLGRTGRGDHLQPDLARLAADHPGHRRTVVGERPVAAPLIGPGPRRVVGVGVLDPLLAGVLVHLVALDHVITQRVAVQPPLGVVLHEPAQLQQVLAVAAQLAGQPRRGDPLGEAAEDEHDLGGRAMRPAPAACR